jgi:heat shock protein HtpX
MSSEKKVVVETDLPNEAVDGLSNFFERYYILANRRYIDQESYRKTKSGDTWTFFWKLNVAEKDQQPVFLYSHLKIDQKSVELSFRNLDDNDSRQNTLCARTGDDVQNIVWSYLQNAMTTNLYFVIGSDDERHSEAPSEEGSTNRSVLKRILSGNSANVFLLFMLLSFVLFFTIGFYALFFLIGSQFVYLFYADKIMLNMGNVRPTPERPLASVVSVRTNGETVSFLRKHGKKILADIRKSISNLHVMQSVDQSVVAPSIQGLKFSIIAILARYGITVSADAIEIKTKNVYGIVQKIAEKFHQPVPKIVIVNAIVSNASATGISAKRSSIMITAGSLQELTDQELETIIGHELGHVKGHDPVILFGVTGFQFVGMFYLWYPLVEFLGLFYFVVAFSVIFAIGKILETRADTESAIILGDPQAFADSLKKIGFRELYREKYNPVSKLLDWFRFDPHPPTYFRVSRMSEFIGRTSAVKHAFLVSLRDCIVGFFSAFS